LGCFICLYLFFIISAADATQDDEYYDYPYNPFAAASEKAVAAAAAVSSSESHSFHTSFVIIICDVSFFGSEKKYGIFSIVKKL